MIVFEMAIIKLIIKDSLKNLKFYRFMHINNYPKKYKLYLPKNCFYCFIVSDKV